jgi:predicted dehydrogenase
MGTEHAKLTVGIIGAGGNTRLRHLPNLQVLPGVEVRIVCNRTIASARAAADQFAIPHVRALDPAARVQHACLQSLQLLRGF